MLEGRKSLYTIVVLQVIILVFAVLIGHSLGKAQVRNTPGEHIKFEMLGQAIGYIKDRYVEEDVPEEKLVMIPSGIRWQAIGAVYDRREEVARQLCQQHGLDPQWHMLLFLLVI